MCLWDKARVNTVGRSPPKQWSQSSAGAFYNSSVFTKTPPDCFHRQENQLFSFALKPLAKKGKKRQQNNWIALSCVLFVSAAIQQNTYLRPKHNTFFAILSTELQTLLFVMFFKALRKNTRKSRKQSSLCDLITVLFSLRPRQNRKVNQAEGSWRLIYEAKVHEI